MDLKKWLVKFCNFCYSFFSERRMKTTTSCQNSQTRMETTTLCQNSKTRMETTMSDLPEDLVVEMSSRIPLRLVRFTCKTWNALSRNQIFGKVAEEEKNQFVGFIIVDFKICSLRMDLQGISYAGQDVVSIKQLSVLNHQIEEVSKVYHYDGLLLCIPKKNNSRLLVWNPYLGQTRLIRHKIHRLHRYALGYDNDRNHKILEILDYGYNIYKFSSNSWRRRSWRRSLPDVFSNCNNWVIIKTFAHTVTLKGNAYFYAEEKKTPYQGFLHCFDFTSERFGPRLSLPFHRQFLDIVILSGVGDKQLAVLYYSPNNRKMEIWITNKIDYNEVLWTKWMEVDMNLVPHFRVNYTVRSFFIDEENKVAVVFNLTYRDEERRYYRTANIFEQNGYFKSIDVPGASIKSSEVKGFLREVAPLCCSYVPSLVEIE